jgi:hypothetical protein
LPRQHQSRQCSHAQRSFPLYGPPDPWDCSAQRPGVTCRNEAASYASDTNAGAEAYAFGPQLAQAAVKNAHFQSEVGFAVAQQPAGPISLLEDGDPVPCAGKKRPLIACLARLTLRTLRIEVERKLIRVRSKPESVAFPRTFIGEPGLDHILREHLTLEEELMVVFQRVQGRLE